MTRSADSLLRGLIEHLRSCADGRALLNEALPDGLDGLVDSWLVAQGRARTAECHFRRLGGPWWLIGRDRVEVPHRRQRMLLVAWLVLATPPPGQRRPTLSNSTCNALARAANFVERYAPTAAAGIRARDGRGLVLTPMALPQGFRV